MGIASYGPSHKNLKRLSARICRTLHRLATTVLGCQDLCILEPIALGIAPVP